MKLHFCAAIALRGINPCILVRADQAARLKSGWRKPMPVLVQVNGAPETPWRINPLPRSRPG